MNFGWYSGWRNVNLSTGLKLRLFRYLSCTWKVTSIVASRLQIFVNWCVQKILRIYWPNNISNTALLQRANMECKDEKSLARKAMEWNPLISAVRLPGRPREIWTRTVARESKIIGKSWNELKALAHHRYWRPMFPMGSRISRRRRRYDKTTKK